MLSPGGKGVRQMLLSAIIAPAQFSSARNLGAIAHPKRSNRKVSSDLIQSNRLLSARGERISQLETIVITFFTSKTPVAAALSLFRAVRIKRRQDC